MAGLTHEKPGDRHPTWPIYLCTGMVVWTNFPDSPEPFGRIIGARDATATPRHAQPAVEGADGVLRLVHQSFLIPCPPTKRGLFERVLGEWVTSGKVLGLPT